MNNIINKIFGLNLNARGNFKEGIKKYIGLSKNKIGTGGTNSAKYCYTVWMRHLYFLYINFSISEIPKSIMEIGPGDSLGIGISGLLSGANNLIALDSIAHSNKDGNIRILNELYYLFNNFEKLAADDEFPNVFPKLKDYNFPSFIKDIIPAQTELLKRKLEIEKALTNNSSDLITIKYINNWKFENIKLENSVDLIISQAVMEHIENLDLTYMLFSGWLNDKGLISHTIDYKCHGLHDLWNGHWNYNTVIWKIILNGYGYCINRKPHSYHIDIINKYFNNVFTIVEKNDSGIKHVKKGKSNIYKSEDYYISTSFIQAKKNE